MFYRTMLDDLHQAIMNERTDTVLSLLKRGVSVNDRFSQRRTPLMLAVCTGNAPLIRILMRENADPTACDCYGHTALWMVHNGTTSLIQYNKPQMLEEFQEWRKFRISFLWGRVRLWSKLRLMLNLWWESVVVGQTEDGGETARTKIVI